MNIDAIKARVEATKRNAQSAPTLSVDEVNTHVTYITPPDTLVVLSMRETEEILSELTVKDAEITRLRSLEPYLLSLQAEEWHKDAEEERACNKKLVAKINDMAKEKQALTARAEKAEAELAKAVEDLNLAGDCDTCDMRGKKGFSACWPLFTGDSQTCANYKWRGSEAAKGGAE